jgi:hypothetical protein
MGLGKLGAFGKTNVLDVTGSLFKQYNEGLANAEQARRNRLIDELRVREEKRSEAKFSMEKADYDRKNELINTEDLRKTFGSERVFKRLFKGYEAQGMIKTVGDQTFIRREDTRLGYDNALKFAGQQQTAVLDDRLADLADRKAELEEQAKTESGDKLQATQARIAQITRETNNLATLYPEFQKYEAQERAKAGLKEDLLTPFEKQKREAELNATLNKAEADAALAARRRAEAELFQAGGKGVMTTSNLNALDKATESEFQARYFPPSTESTNDRFKVGGSDKNIAGLGTLPEGLKTGTPEFWQYVRSKDPEMYTRLVETKDRAEEIFYQHKGKISHKQAARMAIQELEDRRMEINSGPAADGSKKRPTHTNPPFPNAQPEPARTAVSEVRFNNDNTIDIPNVGESGMRFQPPRGFQDHAKVKEAIEAARRAGVQPEALVKGLLDSGYIVAGPLGEGQDD